MAIRIRYIILRHRSIQTRQTVLNLKGFAVFNTTQLLSSGKSAFIFWETYFLSQGTLRWCHA